MKNILKAFHIDGRSFILRRRLESLFVIFLLGFGGFRQIGVGGKHVPGPLFPFRPVGQSKPDMRAIRTLDLAPFGAKIMRINPESACAVRTGEYHGRRILLK